MTEHFVECDKHGLRPETFVCKHIASGLFTQTSPGFVAFPGSDMDYPDAWCPACEEYKLKSGGDWTDQNTPAGLFKLLCCDCYLDARELADTAGRLDLRT